VVAAPEAPQRGRARLLVVFGHGVGDVCLGDHDVGGGQPGQHAASKISTGL
jgi:hypothetical protein